MDTPTPPPRSHWTVTLSRNGDRDIVEVYKDTTLLLHIDAHSAVLESATVTLAPFFAGVIDGMRPE